MSPFRRPSPAMAVALVALFLALGGSVYAATKIGTSQLKRNAVTTAKIKNGAVKEAKLADGAVTGAKADESSFATVPSADSVGGLTASDFAFKGAPNAPLTTVKTIGLLEIRAGCTSGVPLMSIFPAGGAPSTAVTVGLVESSDASDFNGTFDLDSSGLEILDGFVSNASGHLEAVTSTGRTTTINFGARASSNFSSSENVCLVYGTGLSS